MLHFVTSCLKRMPSLDYSGWILLFQEFDLEIHDRKGIENRVANHLSRLHFDAELPVDDRLPEENVYFIANIEACYREKADLHVL